MTLYTYTIPIDDGAAPNPFWGVCTLAICKPSIRRTAKIGDWIVGTGSKKYGFENHVVYAMKVTSIMTFQEYDAYCHARLPKKIPDGKSADLRHKAGDCVYDFTKPNNPKQRLSIHTMVNMATDLSGVNVLLSEHFYYFGSEPVPLPTKLLKIVHQGQGHKSVLNAPYAAEFEKWIDGFAGVRNQVTSEPFLLKEYFGENPRSYNKGNCAPIKKSKSPKQ